MLYNKLGRLTEHFDQSQWFDPKAEEKRVRMGGMSEESFNLCLPCARSLERLLYTLMEVESSVNTHVEKSDNVKEVQKDHLFFGPFPLFARNMRKTHQSAEYFAAGEARSMRRIKLLLLDEIAFPKKPYPYQLFLDQLLSNNTQLFGHLLS